MNSRRADAELDRLATAAAGRIEDLSRWIARIRDVVARWHDGSGGHAVDRAAAALAAMHAVKTTARGRPPAARETITVVLAIDADWSSGRRAMPGRARAAWLSGCSISTVSGAVRHLIQVAGVRETRRGGRTTLAVRVATGRWNDRSVYDLPPLDWSPVAQAARADYVPRVLELVAELLDRAQALLDAEVDRLRAAAGPEIWAERWRHGTDRHDQADAGQAEPRGKGQRS